MNLYLGTSVLLLTPHESIRLGFTPTSTNVHPHKAVKALALFWCRVIGIHPFALRHPHCCDAQLRTLVHVLSLVSGGPRRPGRAMKPYPENRYIRTYTYVDRAHSRFHPLGSLP